MIRRALGVARAVAPGRLPWAGMASGALHGLVAVAMAWRPVPGASPPPDDRATLQVEFVSQPAATMGAPANAQPPAPAPPALVGPVPLPAPPTQPMVNLGDSDDDRDALTVTGDVVSPGPDPRYRNKPPGYPRAALLLHEQGTVQVLIHVAPDGAAERVELVASSGSAALDEAGLAAVAKWHFAPALRDGVPVASVYPLSMNFRGHE